MCVTDGVAQSSGYETALARYRECLGRIPLYYHTVGRARLAATGTPEALQVLAEDYASPKSHAEQARYALATLFGRHFDDEAHLPALAAMRTAHDKDADAWLWMRTLAAETRIDGDRAALAIATDPKRSAIQRAAAIAAIGAADGASLKAAVVANCVEFPRAEADRMVLLGAMTGALWQQKERVNDDDYCEALTAYISLLGRDVRLGHTAKVQMARHLQWILNAPAMFENEQAWQQMLARGDVKTNRDRRTRAQPSFFGIESEGERICYVVDMSDSMCKPISPDARPKGPITGPRKRKRGLALDESDLPWHEIYTRWDLAREQLRISLSRLTPDKHFSIVWFGTEAGPIAATKGMVKATKSRIKKAMAELDAIPIGPPRSGVAPDGVLRGRTNLHAGLRMAFALSGKGFASENAYVDRGPLTKGCDTVFLLSDGSPSWDDFGVTAPDYGEGQTVLDNEYNRAAARTPLIEYFGPYTDPAWLVEDTRRMNVFRRIRIHCVGLGEANQNLLERLAEIGNGEVFFVGRKK